MGVVARGHGRTRLFSSPSRNGKEGLSPPILWDQNERGKDVLRIHSTKKNESLSIPIDHAWLQDEWVLAPVRIQTDGPQPAAIIGTGALARSETMLDCLLTTMQYGATSAPTFIHGETGTGKEAIASLLHESSPQKKGPLITINCGALPEGIAHSELFGRERGSYTGATHEAPGLLEQAHGGTLFLDEVAELSLANQVRLLRFLETGILRRIGAGRPRRVNIRVVSATHVDLLEASSKGLFRKDLLYRLCVLEVRIPPLRSRRGDIETLTHHFLKEFNHPCAIHPDALHELQKRDWFGNVRQLRNVLYRAAILSGNERLQVHHLGGIQREAEKRSSRGLQRSLDERIQREFIRQGGNRSRTCEVLDISKSTLYRWLKKNPHLMQSASRFSTSSVDTPQLSGDDSTQQSNNHKDRYCESETVFQVPN
jgi:DNA-binding NtrC family response regulator